MAKGRNGNIIKWIGIGLALALAAAVWIWNASTISSTLNANSEEDKRVHPIAEQSEKSIIGIEKDIDQIQKDQTRVIKSQESIEKKLDDLFMLQISGPGSGPTR